MNAELELKVRDEVEALHVFFTGWIHGELSIDAFEADFVPRFDPEFLLVQPSGNLVPLDELLSAARGTHASNPEFRIAIRNVKVRRAFGNHVLATYEEWQRNAVAPKPPNNARMASIIFKQTDRLEWFHCHETWLPDAIASAGPYNF